MKTSSFDRRRLPAIGAGAMADIAFLLLIFFLVATTILNDSGILVRLPPFLTSPPADIASRNVLSVKINGYNELLVEGVPAQPAELRRVAKEFVFNPMGRTDMAVSPAKAVISLQHDRGTNYSRYIEVYDELVGAYREMWDQEARRLHGKNFDQLSGPIRKSIRRRLPMIISEAEPTGYVAEELY